MLSFIRSLFSVSPRISVAEARQALADGAALLVDVREADELRSTGRAKGALHLPLSSLAHCADPKSGRFARQLKPAFEGKTRLILYCASGARSGRAAALLRAKGYAQVDNLGSLRDWQAAGGPLQR